MKILFVYPQYPDAFWSFKYALRFISKKAAFPPLGLLTVAAMLPEEWQKKLVDMNITTLTDEDIKWADYVFISAMIAQQESVKEVIARCGELHTKMVAGGPLFTTGYEQFNLGDVDHLVLGEAEDILPLFLEDLQKGCAQHIYESSEHPEITKTPVPLWELVDMGKYASMNVQYSRGCPFNCEFCDIVILDGHRPRTKDKSQLIAEFEALYGQGWRSSIFIVDDNFIGNKRKLKEETLPAMVEWSQKRKYPFRFFTEASINLADDEELMQLMTKAGFDTVFVGIETTNEESLVECSKVQNVNRDLVASVKKMQNYGLEVQGGFIVGFDSDPVSIFKSQINFIQKSGIVTAMVGLLNAPPGTRLYHRLKKENRLLPYGSGDNTDGTMNFIPKMNQETLITGYKNVVKTIYSAKPYYERIKTFLEEYKPQKPRKAAEGKIHFYEIKALIKSMWVLGVKEKGRRHYWGLFSSTLLRKPRLFPLFVTLSVYGFHFRKVAEKIQ
ncbi:MAG: B12-binding domain-containing radical SAM protein [Chloroflexi bacterium]|nr:MAG: B12-binding domain-containing radical SAM protein [Chloroflexota bacterium]